MKNFHKTSRLEDRKGRIKDQLQVKADKWLPDVECKVAAVARDTDGRPVSGLIKLYRDGDELKTARKVWVDFVVINNADTVYHVASMTVYDGTAYDVVIVDDAGICHYNGYKKRMAQERYAREHGTRRPFDSIMIEEAIARQQRRVNTEKAAAV